MGNFNSRAGLFCNLSYTCFDFRYLIAHSNTTPNIYSLWYLIVYRRIFASVLSDCATVTVDTTYSYCLISLIPPLFLPAWENPIIRQWLGRCADTVVLHGFMIWTRAFSSRRVFARGYAIVGLEASVGNFKDFIHVTTCYINLDISSSTGKRNRRHLC